MGFNFFDLVGVAGSVLGHDDQPLIAVEVAECDVGKEVAAKIGLGFGDEGQGLGSGSA